MMRKFNKKKAAKRGAILVTVVFILAFATIFIAAAMMLTQNTRRRVYTEAESNQARLTVTSVAESWYRAMKMCEFDDSKILSLCSGNETIHVKAPDVMPGIEKEGATETPDNCTLVHFYRALPAGATTSTNDDYNYYVEFTTTIGSQKENVRAELTYVTPPNSGKAKPFGTQIDLNGFFGQNNLELIGDGSNIDPLDNIFLARKGANPKNSSFSSYSTMVYCDGDITFKDEKFYSTDMVFLSGAKLKSGDSGHFDNDNSNVKNMFFFGDDGGTIGNCPAFNASGITFFLCNRSNDTDTTSGAVDVIEIKSNGQLKNGGNVYDDDGLNDAFVAKVQKYAQYNASYKGDGGEEPFPTIDEFLASAGNLGLTSAKTAPSSGTYKGSLKNFYTSYCYQKTGAALPSGTYIFTSDGYTNNGETHADITGAAKQKKAEDGTTYKFDSKEPYIMVLNGANSYKFWFCDSKTYKLFNVVFVLYNPDPSRPALFLLEDGVEVDWPGGPWDPNDPTKDLNYASNGKVGANGIYSVQGRTETSKGADDAYKYVQDTIKNNASSNGTSYIDKPSSAKYASYYDGKNESCAMVIGMGHNTFHLDKNVTMECFIGLFNESYGSSAKSHFSIRNNTDGLIYGRLMTDGYDDLDSAKVYMPQSPAKSGIDGTDPSVKKLITNFTLVKMTYYYT